jgi:polyisoprenoid-binding protein YceI
MLAKKLNPISLLTVATAFLAASALADPVRLGPGSNLTIEGDSTLHPYRTRATRIDASFNLDPQGPKLLAEALEKGTVKSAEIEVAVGAFTSGESGLDENLRKALRASKTPFIHFHLSSYQLTAPSAGSSFGLLLHGTLSVAGVEKPVDVPAQVFAKASGLSVTGVLPLRMTDFKVDPPVLMLGMIRCKDAVAVKFELELPAP